MKSEKNILIAFILNLCFSIFEFWGGIFTGSVSIVSDAVHDLGDAAGIGISYLLEKVSKKQPDEVYTYGYARYSVIGSVITTFILLVGSVAVLCNSIRRIIEPSGIDCNGMILLAVIGVCVNFFPAFFTRSGDSLNQKAVNMHMLEDVLGWVVVLTGAVIMKITDIAFFDPVMSVCISIFILIKAVNNLNEAVGLFLEKAPHGIDIKEIVGHILEIDGVLDVHHIHIWSLDGQKNYATMHIVTNSDTHKIKEAIREEMHQYGISHVTLELETEDENCHEKNCFINHETFFRQKHNHRY